MSALLEVEELQVSFGGRTAAVRGASFRVEKGETHCLVGESGCGKSVTALALMGLLARGGHRTAKRMSFAGTDLLSLPDRAMARIRLPSASWITGTIKPLKSRSTAIPRFT